MAKPLTLTFNNQEDWCSELFYKLFTNILFFLIRGGEIVF